MKKEDVLEFGKIDRLFSVEGKIVLITGAGGLGAMYTEGFVTNGATVILASKTVSKAETECEKLRKKGFACEAMGLNIENKNEVKKVTNKIVEKYGKIDICVHTAAVCQRHSTIDDCEELFDLHDKVNVKGTINVNRIVGNQMALQGWGRIININTMSCWTVNTPDGFSYGVTKAAVKQITKWFGVAYAKKGVTVNGVAPVWIDTPMMACRSEDYWNHCIDQVPMERVAVPEDYLGIVLYMASEAGRYMTGQTIFVDGGWSVSRVFKFDQDKE